MFKAGFSEYLFAKWWCAQWWWLCMVTWRCCTLASRLYVCKTYSIPKTGLIWHPCIIYIMGVEVLNEKNNQYIHLQFFVFLMMADLDHQSFLLHLPLLLLHLPMLQNRPRCNVTNLLAKHYTGMLVYIHDTKYHWTTYIFNDFLWIRNLIDCNITIFKQNFDLLSENITQV